MFYRLSDSLLDEYDYAEDPLLKKKLHAWDRVYIDAMLSYASGISGFGMQMMASQNRVAKCGRDFMLSLGYSERAAKNFRAAMMFHDIGKTHTSFNPVIWAMEDRPTPEEKEERRKHTWLGADMFERLAGKHGLLDHPHFKVRHAVTLYHHERVDGKGPEKKNVLTMPRFVQISCIVDAFDGDQIYRSHQPHQRTPEETLRRLLSLDGHDKYLRAFDLGLIESFSTFIQKKYNFSIH